VEVLDTDMYSPFYADYLDYESLPSSVEDPHERLTSFHLAILELVSFGRKELAYEVYQDLIAKKDFFISNHYPFEEELSDLKRDIVDTIRNCHFQASFSDLESVL